MEAGPSGIRGSITLRKKDSVAAILGAPLEAGERDSFRMSQLIKPGTIDVRLKTCMHTQSPLTAPPFVDGLSLIAGRRTARRRAATAAQVCCR